MLSKTLAVISQVVALLALPYKFPYVDDGPSNLMANNVRISEPPACNNGMSFCEDPDYPYNEVRAILQAKKFPRRIFETEKANIEITGRTDNEMENLCPTKVTTIFPNVGKTIDNHWKYIVQQQGDGYLQGIVVETCYREGKPRTKYTTYVHATKRLLNSTNEEYVIKKTFYADYSVHLQIGLQNCKDKNYSLTCRDQTPNESSPTTMNS